MPNQAHDPPPSDTIADTPHPGEGLSGRPPLDLGGFLDSLDLDRLGYRGRERIRLCDLHSTGGLGEVWRAWDDLLEREVALKRLKLGMAEQELHRARFFREAKITGRLDHPGVVPIYDFTTSEDGRHCFYTMRFIRGRTLREVLQAFHRGHVANGRMTVGGELLQLLGYFLSVCNTVAFAHSRRIIHRDLKGDNVIVGEFGEVLVLDWGLAKDLSETDAPQDASPPIGLHLGARDDETTPGHPFGTPSYMSPEQALGEVTRIDERTDVYGLAAILYEILAGRPPFGGDDIEAVVHDVISCPPIPPSAEVAGVPAELEAVCLRGLAKLPSERPESAAALASEVRTWISDLTARKRTREERERFFDLSSDLMAVVSDRDRLEQINAAWNDLLGMPRSEIIERGLLAWIHPDDLNAAMNALARAWDRSEDQALDLRVCRPDGTCRWIEWKVRPIPFEHALYWVGRDVTDRKRAEVQLEAQLQAAPDATCVVDERGTILRANRAMARMFERDAGELVGSGIEILLPHAVRAGHAEHVRRYFAAPKVRAMGSGLALNAARRSGEEFPVEISLSPVELDGETRVIASIRQRSAR